MRLNKLVLLIEWMRRWARSGGQEFYLPAKNAFVPLEAGTGACVFAGLFFLSLLQAGPWHVFGLEQTEIIGHMRSLYFWHEALYQVVALAVYLVIGAVLGLLFQNAWIIAAGIYPALNPNAMSAKKRIVATGLGVLFVHGFFLFSNMLSHPALYQETFYSRGMCLRAVQIFVTDICPSWLFGVYQILVMLVLSAAGLQIIRRGFNRFRAFTIPVQMAFGILGLGVVLFFLGVWGVFRFNAPKNKGPNVVFLAIDSLRSDVLNQIENSAPLAPHMTAIARQGRTYTSCFPPLASAYGSMATLLTGQSPLTHGIRHPFPYAQDISLGIGNLPSLLKRSGYTTVVLADYAGDFFSRIDGYFDMVRTPNFQAPYVLQQRILERNCHLLPYLSGKTGRRFFPALRNSAGGADPLILAEEGKGMLKQLRFKKKFFLMLYFSALHDPYAVSSEMSLASLKKNHQGLCKYSLPWDRQARKSLSENDKKRVKQLYYANVRAVDKAVGHIMASLKTYNVHENTIVVLWSPHGEQFYERGLGQGHGHHLKGRDIFSAPFVVLEPRFKALPKWSDDPVCTQDVAPTLLDLLDIEVPFSIEGVSLHSRLPGKRHRRTKVFYAETNQWLFPGQKIFYQSQLIDYPGVTRVLDQDLEEKGRFCLSPVWEDHVLASKHRMVQVGDERLIYIPTRKGVVYELYNFSRDPDGVTNLANTTQGIERVKELKEVFSRVMARESGWRPQNEFWIPEAFLKE